MGNASSNYSLHDEGLFTSRALEVKPDYLKMTGLNLVYVAEPTENYFTPPKGVVIDGWRSMLEELKKAGFSVTKISKMTGIPTRTVRRWFYGEEKEIPHHRLFLRVLRLYCCYKNKGSSSNE